MNYCKLSPLEKIREKYFVFYFIVGFCCKIVFYCSSGNVPRLKR